MNTMTMECASNMICSIIGTFFFLYFSLPLILCKTVYVNFIFLSNFTNNRHRYNKSALMHNINGLNSALDLGKNLYSCVSKTLKRIAGQKFILLSYPEQQKRAGKIM